MPWLPEAFVLFVLAGMALPVLRRMRAFPALRSAFAHEPLPVRVAALAFLIASVIYGGGKTNGLDRVGGDLPERGQLVRIDDGGDGGESPSWRDGFALPGWFALAGHDTADADGDGIPDCWERWTGTNPLVADSSIDLDGDGLSNLDEFLLQTDPQCADTDNDAIDDALEAAAMLAGVADFDPLSPATYAASEPDANTNGVPDAWEGSPAGLFAGVASDGFLWNLPVPDDETGTYDVALTVSSSRFALLAWGDDGDEAVLLPPCTNLAIRLRLDASETRTVSLSAAPPGAAAGALLGNWRAEMAVAWDSRRNLATEGDRVAVGNGTMVDCPTRAAAYRGALFGAGGQPPLRGGVTGAGGGPLEISFVPKWMHLIYQGGNSCAEHGPSPMVELVSTNVPPPYRWSHDLHRSVSDSAQYCAALPWLDYTSTTVSCSEADGEHTNLLLHADILIGLGHCEQSATNLLPITALAGFDAMTNHAPKVDSPTSPNGVNCPEAQIVNVYAGWGGDYICDRNFETIPTGDDADDLTSHCIAIDWTNNHEIDLEAYLPEELLPFKDELSYRVNGNGIDGSTIPPCEKPEELLPTIYHVEMLNDADTTLDRLWVLVLNPATRTKFNTWVSQNSTNATWFGTLPKPPSKIFVSASGAATLPSAASANWNAPEPFPTNYFMHPKAAYELRASSLFNEHGHQATYDEQGNLITDSIKAGTADFSTPYPTVSVLRPLNHRDNDVRPYVQALQLDGNPILPVDSSGNISTFWMRNLSRPPLRVGPFTQQYLHRRPTTPSGVQLIQ